MEEHKLWFSVIKSFNEKNNELSNYFYNNGNNKEEYSIFSKAIKNEESFKQFWQEENYKLFTNDFQSFKKVFFNLRKIICDKFITDHVLYDQPLNQENLYEIEEFQTLELDEPLLQNTENEIVLTTEEMNLKYKKLLDLVKVEHVVIKKPVEKKEKIMIDQDTLNDSFKQVLRLLSDHESAWPFQQPVSLEEAEDYYDVIKNPMDFKTMKSNIQKSRYHSKEEIVSDLILIWENCKQFNERKSIYYKCAETMNSYMESILYLIPEQPFKEIIEEQVIEIKQDVEMKEPDLSPEEQFKLEKEFCDKIKEIDEKKKIKKNLDYFNREDYWNLTTKLERIYFIKKRNEEMKKPFSEREALKRTGDEMSFYYFKKHGIELDFEIENENKIEYKIKKEKPISYPEYFNLMNFIPETTFEKKIDILKENDGGINFNKILKNEQIEMIDDVIHHEENLKFNPLGENNKISENVKNLFHLRKKQKKIDFLQDEKIENDSLIVHDESSALEIIKTIIGLFLVHEGYEFTDESAIDLFTEIVNEYFKKFTKNLNTFSLLNTNRSFGFQSLMKCFGQIGIKDITELKKFNEEKVESTKRRLKKVELVLDHKENESKIKIESDELPDKKKRKLDE
eukprot:gene3580-6315_t